MISSVSPTESMRKIVSKMKEMKTILGNLGVEVPITQLPRTTPIPPLHLPFPTDILASIESFGLPEYLSQKLARTLTNRINMLQGSILQSYEQTCRDMPELITSPCQLNGVRGYLENFNNDHLDRFRQQLLNHKMACRKDVQPKKSVFNAEYTPFLEKYFEYNAYPSAPDRLVLARKSMMTPRQIEVWFQNHRNRAKKEGKSLPRSSSSLPLKLSLESLAEKRSIFSVSKTESSSALDEDSSDEGVTDIDDVVVTQVAPSVEAFSNSSPRHSFPTPYSSACSYSPFPNDNGIFKFPPPVWKRQPSTTRTHSHSRSITMDELALMFTCKLNLREGCKTENGRRVSVGQRRPWFAPMVTIPPPAPHPALVRARPDGSTVPLASRSMEIAYASLGSANGVPATPLPSAKSRKLAPLSRRTRPNKDASNSTFPSLPSQSSDSRTSSFSSATSSQSRSSSSSISLTDDPLSHLLPPPVLVNEPHLNEEQLDTLTAFAIGIRHPPNDFTSNYGVLRNNGMMAKDMYSISPLATVPFNFIVAQS